MNYKKRIGDLGERIARLYLEACGYVIVCCNYRALRCEIDIIAKKNSELHFVEVKTRTDRKISALEAIDDIKCRHIEKAAEYYLYKNNISDVAYHFDAVEVYIEEESMVVNYVQRIIEN